MTKFFTVNERKTRIAELCAEITAAGGTAPTNCDGFKTSQEAKAEIAQLESILAECRAKKAAAKPGAAAPLIACLADKTAVREAITARLEASKAAVAASTAKLKAQQAVAAIQPAATVTAAEFETKPLRMSRAEFNKLTPADKSRFSTTGGKLI